MPVIKHADTTPQHINPTDVAVGLVYRIIAWGDRPNRVGSYFVVDAHDHVVYLAEHARSGSWDHRSTLVQNGVQFVEVNLREVP